MGFGAYQGSRQSRDCHINQLQDYEEKSRCQGEGSRSTFGNIYLWDVEEMMFKRQLLM